MDLGGGIFKGEPGLEGGDFGLEVGDEREEGGGGAGNVTEATAVFRAVGGGVVNQSSIENLRGEEVHTVLLMRKTHSQCLPRGRLTEP